MADDRPFRIPATPDAVPPEPSPQPPPPVLSGKPATLPSHQGSDGTAHSTSIKWAPAGGHDDAAKPFKRLR